MRIAEPLTAKGQTTSTQILAAATRVLARDGMAGATLGRIAEEARVDKRNITYYYGSREMLLVRVVQSVGERLASAIETSITTSPETVTASPAEIMWTHITSEPQIPRAYITMLGGVGDTPEIDRALSELKDRWLGMIAGQLSAARPTDTEHTDLATLILAVLRGLLLEWAETGDGPAITDGLHRVNALLTTAPEPVPTTP